MLPYRGAIRLISFALAVKHVLSSCEPALAFPKPSYSLDSLRDAFTNISQALTGYLSNPVFDATNAAVEITSSHETLGTFYWTAKNTSSQGGAKSIDTNTIFRIARVSKLFTALAVFQLHTNKRFDSLDDPVVRYISGLESGAVNWSRITIRDLLLNTGGIMDNYNYADVLTALSAEDRDVFGLPPMTAEMIRSMHDCELNQNIPCDSAGLLSRLRETPPVLAPHIEYSNSNAGYGLLGLVIANVSGTTFEDYITQTIIRPLGLHHTGFQTPDQKLGAVPRGERSWAWNVGVNNPQVVSTQKPSLGLYCTPHDLSKLLRWILADAREALPYLDWFAPGNYATGSHSLIGAPWNIFRTSSILSHTDRPVTFNTVVGTLGKYTAVVALMPEYDLAFTLLMSGELGSPHGILRNISFPLIKGAEDVSQQTLNTVYAGRYVSANKAQLNSSITLLQSSPRSLYIAEWISNNTSILPAMQRFTAHRSGAGSEWYFQLVPTFLPAQRRALPGRSAQIGEDWRWTYVLDAPMNEGWNDWCLSSFDPEMYAGQSLTRFTFWKNEHSGNVEEVQLHAYNVTLAKGRRHDDDFRSSQWTWFSAGLLKQGLV